MGYKKQSKRKSPFKAYGRSQKNAVRFDKLTDAQNNRNLLGQAVGAIGTNIGDAVQEYEKNKQDKDNAELAPAPTITEEQADPSTFDPNSVEYIEEPFEDPEIPPYTPKPGTVSKGIPPGKSVYTYDQFGRDAYQKAINEGKSPTDALSIQSKAIADARASNAKQFKSDTPTAEGQAQNFINFESNGNSYVPGSASATEGSTTQGSPENSRALQQPGPFSGTSLEEQQQPPFNRISPFKRMVPLLRSPFYATKGVPAGELAQSSLTNLSYLGQAGQAGAEGYNSQVDRHNYAATVREEQAAELDEEFGELEVAPSGYKAYDASVEGLAREWKGEFVDAKKAWKSGKMSNEDWIDTKHRLQGNAASYGKAAKTLQESMKNWIDNKGQISNSTKPEIVDFFNTMEKAPDSLTVQNIDGVPYFIGETLGKKAIKIPVDQIANGAAPMRFNTKIDLTAELAPMVKGLESMKTDIQTSTGLGHGTQAWDTPAVQNKVNQSLDNIVNNNAKLRAIASETLGLDYDEFEDRLKTDGLDWIKDNVKEELKNDIRDSYFPSVKTVKTNQQLRNDQLLGKAREAQLAGGSKKGGSPAELAAEHQNVTNIFDNLDPQGADLSEVLGLKEALFDGTDYYIGGTRVSKAQMKQLYLKKKGFKQSQIDDSGLYRVRSEAKEHNAPFKRIMNYAKKLFTNK